MFLMSIFYALFNKANLTDLNNIKIRSVLTTNRSINYSFHSRYVGKEVLFFCRDSNLFRDFALGNIQTKYQ